MTTGRRIESHLRGSLLRAARIPVVALPRCGRLTASGGSPPGMVRRARWQRHRGLALRGWRCCSAGSRAASGRCWQPDDGIVSIIAARAEMGNGAARTALPMIVADELDADWARVRVVQSPGDEKTYGNQDTDGSRSVRHFIQPMRQCGAAARKMLEQAAAKKWAVPEGEVEAQLHEVVHKPSGRRFGYGELAVDAAGLPVPADDK